MVAERDRENRTTRWDVEAAGFPCTVELEDGEWVVTFASATVARHPNLVTAIMNACGGLVSAGAADELATVICSSHPGR